MNTFKHIGHATKQWIAQRYERHTLQKAATHAYRIFARQYPQWVAALFDDHFVSTHVLPLLQKAAGTGEAVTPVQVAALWARQINVVPSLRQQHTTRMIPAATHFLCLVADELAETAVGQKASALVVTAAS